MFRTLALRKPDGVQVPWKTGYETFPVNFSFKHLTSSTGFNHREDQRLFVWRWKVRCSCQETSCNCHVSWSCSYVVCLRCCFPQLLVKISSRFGDITTMSWWDNLYLNEGQCTPVTIFLKIWPEFFIGFATLVCVLIYLLLNFTDDYSRRWERLSLLVSNSRLIRHHLILCPDKLLFKPWHLIQHLNTSLQDFSRVESWLRIH